MQGQQDCEPDGKNMKNVEREAIIAAMRQKGGNINQAAGLLGISRNTIYNKLRRYNLAIADFRNEETGKSR